MRTLLVGNMGLFDRIAFLLPRTRELAEENARLAATLEEQEAFLRGSRAECEELTRRLAEADRRLKGSCQRQIEIVRTLAETATGMQRAQSESSALTETLRASEAARQALEAELDQARAQPQTPAPALWVPPGHFYSPLVDPTADTVRRAIAEEANPTHQPADLGVDAELMLEWFHRMAEEYREEPFSREPVGGRLYHYDNPHFPLADALALLTFLKRCGTRRYLEIGAGFSSCAAIDIGENHLPQELQLTFIEPFPELAFQLLGENSPYRHRVIPSRLQDLPLDLFRSLDRNDVLFIDSSHIAKTGSDVLDYLFRILPTLKPGVLVHIHDIFFPFEYPGLWIVDQNRSWNEAYFLRAFLQGNAGFRVLFWNDWFFKCQRELVLEQMPLCVEFRGGSIWLEALG